MHELGLGRDEAIAFAAEGKVRRVSAGWPEVRVLTDESEDVICTPGVSFEFFVTDWLHRRMRSVSLLVGASQAVFWRDTPSQFALRSRVFDVLRAGGLVAFMAAQAQAEATKEAQRAGIAHAKQKGEYLGRKPSYTREQLDAVRELLGQSVAISQIAKATDLSRQTVYRIKDDFLWASCGAHAHLSNLEPAWAMPMVSERMPLLAACQATITASPGS